MTDGIFFSEKATVKFELFVNPYPAKLIYLNFQLSSG